MPGEARMPGEGVEMPTTPPGEQEELLAGTSAPPGVPPPGESELAKEMRELKELIKTQAEEMVALKLQLGMGSRQAKEKDEKDEHSLKLKPIDIKDIKKPSEYDGKVEDFPVWYERLKDLMTNRHNSWAPVLKAIEDMKGERITDAKTQIFE